MNGTAAASNGTSDAIAGSRSTARWRVMAPTRKEPSSRRIPKSSGTRLRSIRCSKRVRRKASMGTRLCPPASGLHSSPCSPSSATVSATVSGAWYSNGAGFTR